MKKDYIVIGKIPERLKKIHRNAKARERYFIKRYGNLDRMYAIDERFQNLMDEMSFNDEIENTNDL